MNKRLMKLLTCVVFVAILMSAMFVAYAEGGTPKMTTDIKSVNLESGKMQAVQLTLDNVNPANVVFSSENPNVAYVQLLVQNRPEYFYIYTNGAGKTTITITDKSNPNITVKIPVTVRPNYTERAAMNAVETINNYKFMYLSSDNEYALVFGFKDANRRQVSAPVTVHIKIVDDKKTVRYEKTHYVTMDDFLSWTATSSGNKLNLGSIFIPYSDIAKGATKKGTVSFTVECDYWSFDTIKITVDNLPKK